MEHPDAVAYIPKSTVEDRIDRRGWNPRSLDGITDAHLLHRAYMPSQWAKLRKLILLMYGMNSSEVKWCDDYYTKFKLFNQIQ